MRVLEWGEAGQKTLVCTTQGKRKALTPCPPGKSPDAFDAAEYWSFGPFKVEERLQVALCDHLSVQYVKVKNRRGRGLSKSQKQNFDNHFPSVVAGVMVGTDLSPDRWVYRPGLGNKKKAYEPQEKRVPYDVFERTVLALEEVGFLQRVPAPQDRTSTITTLYHDGAAYHFYDGGRMAQRYEITSEFVAFLEALGVTFETLYDFISSSSIVLRKDDKTEFEADPVLRANIALWKEYEPECQDIADPKDSFEFEMKRQWMDRYNVFLSEHTFGDRQARPPQFRRIFNGVAGADYAFNEGGRLYQFGSNGYQQWQREDAPSLTASQVRVRDLKIDGEPVVALDCHASFHWFAGCLVGGLTPGEQVGIYDIPGLADGFRGDTEEVRAARARATTKQLVVSAFGQGSMPTRWPADASKPNPENYLGAEGYRGTLKKLVAQIFTQRPVLQRSVDSGINSLRLQFEESEAFIQAISSLQQEGIVALPMHDELIVPASAESDAWLALDRAFLDRRPPGLTSTPFFKVTRWDGTQEIVRAEDDF